MSVIPVSNVPSKIGFFDVETTGFTQQDRVISIGIIVASKLDSNNSKFNLTYTHLIFNPERDSHPKAAQVHGFPKHVLDLQEKFSLQAKVIHEMLEDTDLLVAHNATFDTGFVNRELALSGLPKISRPTFCTMNTWREKSPGTSARLGDVCKALNLGDQSKQHSALQDAFLAMLLYFWFKGVTIHFSFSDLTNPGPRNFISR